jgi:hypothetical protein
MNVAMIISIQVFDRLIRFVRLLTRGSVSLLSHDRKGADLVVADPGEPVPDGTDQQDKAGGIFQSQWDDLRYQV